MESTEPLDPGEPEPATDDDAASDGDEPVEAERQATRNDEVFDLVGVPLS